MNCQNCQNCQNPFWHLLTANCHILIYGSGSSCRKILEADCRMPTEFECAELGMLH